MENTQNIVEYIAAFREKHGEYFFLHGGCYIFARILQMRFGGQVYDNVDHCVLRKDCLFYDITGEVKQNYDLPYTLSDDRTHRLYEKYENWNH